MTQQGLSCSVVQLQRDGRAGYIDFEMSLFGNGVSRADVEFLYRASPVSPWLSDATISADNANHSEGNKMYGVPCSREGERSVFRWEITKDSLVSGMSCEIRLVLHPDPMLFSYYNGATFVESLLGSGHIVVEGRYYQKVVGFSSNGGLMVLDNTSFSVYLNGERTVVVSGLSYPSFALEKDDGNYIIADSGGNRIVEADPSGLIVKSRADALLWGGVKWLHYDSLTGNLLVSRGQYPRVHELSWDDRSYGTILWFYGQTSPGSAIGYLNNPIGISYMSDNRDVVLIADSGNDRVVVVDRTPAIPVVTHIGSVSFSGTPVPLQGVLATLSSGGLMQIVEGNGEKEYFGTTMSTHPALARALDLGAGTKNGLQWYKNLVFGAVTRGVD
jgi:hypothetical protein